MNPSKEIEALVESGMGKVISGNEPAAPPTEPTTPAPAGEKPREAETPPAPPAQAPAEPTGPTGSGDSGNGPEGSAKPETPSEPVAPDILKDLFGEEVDVSGAKNKIEELRKKSAELERQNNIIQMKLKDASGYATPEIKQFNSFVRDTKIDNYNVFKRIKDTDAETARQNPIDVLVTSEISKNPEFAHKESYFRGEVLRKYGLESEADLQELDNEETKTRLEIDASRALKDIEELKSKIKATDDIDYDARLDERNKKIESARTTLTGVMEKVRPNIGKYTYEGAEDGSPQFVFDFDDDTVKGISDSVIEYMSGQENPYDEAEFRNVLGTFYQQAVSQNLPAIMKAFAASVREMTDEEFRKKYTKPSSPQDDGPRMETGSGSGTADAAYELEMNRFR